MGGGPTAEASTSCPISYRVSSAARTPRVRSSCVQCLSSRRLNATPHLPRCSSGLLSRSLSDTLRQVSNTMARLVSASAPRCLPVVAHERRSRAGSTRWAHGAKCGEAAVASVSTHVQQSFTNFVTPPCSTPAHVRSTSSTTARSGPTCPLSMSPLSSCRARSCACQSCLPPSSESTLRYGSEGVTWNGTGWGGTHHGVEGGQGAGIPPPGGGPECEPATEGLA